MYHNLKIIYQLKMILQKRKFLIRIILNGLKVKIEKSKDKEDSIPKKNINKIVNKLKINKLNKIFSAVSVHDKTKVSGNDDQVFQYQINI